MSGETLNFAIANASGANGSAYNTMYYPSRYPFNQMDIPPIQKTWMTINEYTVPVVFTTGIVFNLMMFFVIIKTELKRCTPCLYLVALSVTDNVFLVQKMIPWASRRLYDIYAVPGVCQLTYYCNYLSTFLEWWFVVMLMLDRVLRQYNRKRARQFCNPFRTKCALITVSIFAIVFHLYLTWTSAVIKISNMNMCIIIPENAEDIVQLRKIDIVFAFLFPSSLLIILTMLCLHGILNGSQSNSQRQSLRQRNRGNPNSSSCKRQSAPTVVINAKRIYLKNFESKVFTETLSVTIFSVCLSMCLLVFCVPYDSLRSKLTMINTANEDERSWLQLLHEIYSINFAYKGLFCICFLSQFRLAAWRLLKLSVQSLFSQKDVIELETSDV